MKSRNAAHSKGWPAGYIIYFGAALVALTTTLASCRQLSKGQEFILLNSWRTDLLNGFFQVVTRLGEPQAFVLAGLICLWVCFRTSLLILLSGLTAMVASWALKVWFSAPRPYTFFKLANRLEEIGWVPGLKLASGNTSFPSGHTLAAFTLYTLLCMEVAPRRPLLAFFLFMAAGLTAFSRVYLVQHFVADVLFGSLVGMLLGVAFHSVGRRWGGLQSPVLNRHLRIGR
jgi:membrane-associated phospholipid phosphatase